MRNIAREGQFFVAEFEAAIEILDGVLIELDAHGHFEIGNDVHLCEKRQRHQRLMYLSENSTETFFGEAIDDGQKRHIRHVDIGADFVQKRHGRRNHTLDPVVLDNVCVHVVVNYVAKQGIDKGEFLAQVDGLNTNDKQRYLLLGARFRCPGYGMDGQVGRHIFVFGGHAGELLSKFQVFQHRAQR